MVDTLWSDISEWNPPAGDAYPYQFLCIRSNDGTHLDTHFDQNIAWCRAAVGSGKLWGFLVYYFYRPGVDGAGLLMSRVGNPVHVAVMIDVESAGGQVAGDQSAAINAQHDELVKWLGDPRRVIGYGNVTDLNNLWRTKPSGLRLVIAAYGTNPGYPQKFAHQFADNYSTPPFGPSDLNSADGMSAAEVASMLGLPAPPAPTPPIPTPPTPVPPHPTPGPVPPTPTPIPPSPHPSPPPVPPGHRNVYTPLKLDGVPTLAQMQPMNHVYQTVKALQFVVFNGDDAHCDGQFGPNTAKALQAHVGVAQDGVVGPQTVTALQAHVGAHPDGQWGPQTTYSLQRALNVGSF